MDDLLTQNISTLDAALSRLNIDYWHDVDHNVGRTAHTFFVDEEPEYQIQDQVFAGKAAIRNFYAWREQRGERIARHCVVNARAFFMEDGRAGMDSVLLLFAADGRPVLPTAAPIQIADVKDECVLINGIWKYKTKRLFTLFAGGVPITLPDQ